MNTAVVRTKVVEPNEAEALSAVAVASAQLAAALEALRMARCEPENEPCPRCEDPEKPADDCYRCKGTGRIKKTFPWVVTNVRWEEGEILKPSLFDRGVKWVAVRPCDKELLGKTFLGVLLGDMALSTSVSLEGDGTLMVRRSMYNPAMYVPDLNRVVFGCGSWWAAINSPEGLHQITDADIQDVWYVKALKELSSDNGDPSASDAAPV